MRNLKFVSRLFALFSLLLCTSINATAQWVEENPFTGHQFLDFDFPTEKKGYALVREEGAGTEVYFTDDEGENWEKTEGVFIKDAPRSLQGISFPSEKVGYVVLRANTPSLTSYIFKTDDAGKTWKDVSPNGLQVGTGVADIFFLDDKIGYCTAGNRVHRTTDGGENWSGHHFQFWTDVNQVDFYDKDFGILGAWDGTFAYRGRIYTTKDGGKTWDSLFIEDYQSAVSKVDYTDNNTAYALGGYAFMGAQPLFKTTDGGDSWDTLRLHFLKDSFDQAMDLYFLSSVTGFIVTAKGYIYKTEDGGENWSISHNKTLNIQHISSNGRSLFVGGPQGVLLRSTNQVGIRKVIHQDYSFYPNPSPAGGTVYFEGITPGTYLLTNSMGQVLANVELNSNGQLDMSQWHLLTGCYFLRNESNGATVQFMVQARN